MKINIERSVTVITPTIGSPKLADAVLSVRNQTYSNIKHLIVVDGAEYNRQTNHLLLAIGLTQNMQTMFLPYNTGANGFYGHRIYAGVPHLVNSDYIFFLDEDNWYEPDHVKSLVEVLERGNNFAYSLRQIYNPDKSFLCQDNCEALGKWPIFFTFERPEYLIDTSAFAFNTKFLVKTSQFWHHGWGGDRNYFYSVKDHSKWDCSYKHTLCYRLDGNPNSPNADFFLKGNEEQLKNYKGKLPWTS